MKPAMKMANMAAMMAALASTPNNATFLDSGVKPSFHKRTTPLTPKQKKNRAKSKMARKSRKANRK